MGQDELPALQMQAAVRVDIELPELTVHRCHGDPHTTYRVPVIHNGEGGRQRPQERIAGQKPIPGLEIVQPPTAHPLSQPAGASQCVLDGILERLGKELLEGGPGRRLPCPHHVRAAVGHGAESALCQQLRMLFQIAVCLFLVPDREGRHLLELRRRGTDVAAPEEVGDEQITGCQPGRVIHPLPPEVIHPQVEQAVSEHVLPLSHSTRAGAVQNNFPLAGHTGPVIPRHLARLSRPQIDLPGQISQHPAPYLLPGGLVCRVLRLLPILLFSHGSPLPLGQSGQLPHHLRQEPGG